MIVSAKDCWAKGTKQHADYFNDITENRLKEKVEGMDEWVRIFIIENLETIRDGDRDNFTQLITQFNCLTSTLEEDVKKTALDVLQSIFDYDHFSKKRPNSWCAYKLCETSDIITCPYCNLSFAHTIFRDEQGAIRPTLDHYFDKATYPFLAISIENLVPSCYSCNSSLKGTRNFYKEPHLHPLFDNESIEFSLTNMLNSVGDLRELDASHIILTTTGDAALNSKNTFALSERYEAIEMEAKHITEGIINYRDIPDTLQWVLRGVTAENYKNRIMGKMIMDLMKQFS